MIHWSKLLTPVSILLMRKQETNVFGRVTYEVWSRQLLIFGIRVAYWTVKP